MKAVKVLAVAAIATLGSAVFAEGFNVNGHLRTGVESVIKDGDGIDTPAGAFKTAADDVTGYFGGHNLGLGADRLRVNLSYQTENVGVKFRYQVADNITNTWFDDNGKNVKFAFAYANLFDKLLSVEAGRLNGGYTATHGDEEYAFGAIRNGARVSVFPVEGFVFDVVASDANVNNKAFYVLEDGTKKEIDGTKQSSLDVLSVSAAYKQDGVFGLQAGYALYGEAYFGFDLFAVENLGFSVEGKWLDKDNSEKLNEDNKTVASLKLTEKVTYDINPVSFGIVAKQDLTEDNGSLAFYPYVSFGLDNVLEGLSAGLDFGYVTNKQKAGKDLDDELSITPSVTLAVKEGAKVQLYYTYKQPDDDTTVHAFGLGVKYEF